MRRALTPLLVVGLLASAAVPALAAKPEKAPNEPAPPTEFPAGSVCDFDLLLEVVLDTGHTITFPEVNGLQRVNAGGHVVDRVTNLEGSASVTLNISGPGKLVFDYNNGLLHVSGGGPWLTWVFPEDEGVDAGLYYSRGRISYTADLNTGLLTAIDLPRNTVEMCAVLGGAGA
jgi:hypothetical protein